MLKKFIDWLKKFTPFLGITGLFYFFIILITILFHYYNPTSSAWITQFDPFHFLFHWDSTHYIDIATKGYRNDQSAFFPLYPLLISILSKFLTPIFSGFLISFISFSFALYYLNLLLKETGDNKLIDRTIVLLLFFPSAIFFSLIYTESLFLFLLIAFFYYTQKRKWLTAAIFGLFATLTRNVGIFLFPVYLISLFISYFNPSIKNLGKQILQLLKKKEFWYSILIPTGLLIYCLYSYFRFNDFFAFINGQANWAQWRTFMWPGATFYYFFKIIFLDPISQTGLYNFWRIVVFEGGGFLILLITTIYWLKKRNWPYAIFCLLNTLLFSCMFPMMSVNRYVVVIFPIFIFLAEKTKKANWFFYSLLALFSIFFIFNVYLFSKGAWVG